MREAEGTAWRRKSRRVASVWTPPPVLTPATCGWTRPEATTSVIATTTGMGVSGSAHVAPIAMLLESPTNITAGVASAAALPTRW